MARREFGPDTKLTKRDLEVLGLVKAHVETTGRGPSLRQIATIRGHTSHGPSQRAVQALLATGQLTRDEEGELAVPGLEVSGPALAELVGGAERSWVAAPARGLVAFRTTEGGRFREDTLVFVRAGAKASPSDFVLGKDGEQYFVYPASTQLKNPRGKPQRDIYGGREVEVIGPIKYALVEL